jgi:hypothetical protein
MGRSRISGIGVLRHKDIVSVESFYDYVSLSNQSDYCFKTHSNDVGQSVVDIGVQRTRKNGVNETTQYPGIPLSINFSTRAT